MLSLNDSNVPFVESKFSAMALIQLWKAKCRLVWGLGMGKLRGTTPAIFCVKILDAP